MVIEPPSVQENGQTLTSMTTPQAPLTYDENTIFNFQQPLVVETLTTYTQQLYDRYSKTDFGRSMGYAILGYVIFLSIR